MKIIKKINNNVAIGLDQNEKEVIVFGKGVGFPAIPYELNDLSKIDRTYYDIDPRYYDLINSVDERVLLLCTKMMNVVSTKIIAEWNPNLVFILTDHITFALERFNKGMAIQFPYSDEIEQEYPQENKWVLWNIYIWRAYLRGNRIYIIQNEKREVQVWQKKKSVQIKRFWILQCRQIMIQSVSFWIYFLSGMTLYPYNL